MLTTGISRCRKFLVGFLYFYTDERFGVIARLSKCDFWNLWKISVRHSKNIFEKTFFSRWKIFCEKHLEKNWDQKPKIEIFHLKEITTKNRKICVRDFFKKIFHLEKKFFQKYFYLCRSKIFQRFQKSHLEILKITLNPKNAGGCVFFWKILWISMDFGVT